MPCLLLLLQLENLRERIDEESEKKSDALKALSKAQAEIQLWRSKFETEGLGRVEELETATVKKLLLYFLQNCVRFF